jgi:hypothetical protein
VYLWGIGGGGAEGTADDDGAGVGRAVAARWDGGGTARGAARRVEYTAAEDLAMRDYYCMHHARCVEPEGAGECSQTLHPHAMAWPVLPVPNSLRLATTYRLPPLPPHR